LHFEYRRDREKLEEMGGGSGRSNNLEQPTTDYERDSSYNSTGKSLGKKMEERKETRHGE